MRLMPLLKVLRENKQSFPVHRDINSPFLLVLFLQTFILSLQIFSPVAHYLVDTVQAQARFP